MTLIIQKKSPKEDAPIDESMVVRVLNRDLKVTDGEMLEMLKKAELETYGYKKEVITKLVNESGSDTQVYQKTHYYYRVVDGSKLREIDRELDTLIPGIFVKEVVAKITQEIRSNNLDDRKLCKAGLEVYFEEDDGCDDVEPGNLCRFGWLAKLAA